MLGKEVRDKVTGIAGTVTAQCAYIGAVPRVCVEYINNTGNHEEIWLDESRVEEVINDEI
ncbi:hypothetical protein OBO34_15440 [Clostridiales Family XIII bacterium ASD5510]|uniref:Uncharacterized protein n=1 Tax=Hominibacterium faecale TaxID=2839743 RepID=A0A9J6QVX5_9FIRM|nr:hypothetical protein [Hominibacterium faecale]MCU7379739.1 hypothetical protein [Hominibacterium faecale]